MNDIGFKVEPLPVHRDARGLLVEPVDGGIMVNQSNSHLVFTEPGAVRGNHYHPRGTEITVIVGPALVRVRVDGEDKDFSVPEHEAYRFQLPPGMPHAMQNTGTQPMVLISFNTVAHDPANPDVVREVLIES